MFEEMTVVKRLGGTGGFVKGEVVGNEMTAGAMRSFQVGVLAWGCVLERSKTQIRTQNMKLIWMIFFDLTIISGFS